MKKSGAKRGRKRAEWQLFQESQCLSLARCSRSISQMLPPRGQVVRPTLSHPGRLGTGREVHGSCLDKDGKIPPVSSTLSMPGSMHDVLPTFTQSSPKPWVVGAMIPRLQVKSVSSTRFTPVMYPLSAMPAYEPRYVLP